MRLVVLIVALALLVVGVWLLARALGGPDGEGGQRPAASATAQSAAGKSAAGQSASPSATASPGAPAAWTGPASTKLRLTQHKVISSASIAPKSVVSTGTGFVFAQNMMYHHTMTVYDSAKLKLVKTIKDSVDAEAFGLKGHTGTVQGSPVEAAVAPDGRHMYVSQYSMYGDGFYHEGSDVCSPASGVDDSYVYRVALDGLRIDRVIKVGAVPKFLAVTPDGRSLLVSNWCSYTLSVVDLRKNRQVRSIYIGPYPRGIAVDPASRYAYVAVMGSSDIARVDLANYKITWIRGVGAGPRHLCISGDGRYLYATLNADGVVVKIDVRARKVVDRVTTGSQPRSMAIAPDGASLYVVNYRSGTMSKVRTRDMKVIQVVTTNGLPIGVTYDLPTKSVWVCCYTGSILVFRDR